ncbi:hypothetical protein LTR91_010406 [Friedmanniomyces endolithicus]|uniref:Uncharacterized protein n=1 Tax=Friedmanniomyces endolithicus TaxID=329885 RepID=A0A4U0U8U4_9PEZI|nr:hypothetical protein LTS09_013402 [Friedmanniomyces endolithicus]KAK0291700.1 hypothetical protein LTR35_001128 [Friedmanniomyces endolithicus]KAK0304074.1 hypothetical protein LTR01_007691 [Friedmanniomyces endolithicus]KAK0324775.1 hypothetical protein LTR82_004480 [Friedmanniomyces endolithicus]KAK0826790.1 hypothetical protein LTR73_006124 [Friedmanniomyces endolithicus]
MATSHERCIASLMHARHTYTSFYINLLRNLPDDIFAGLGIDRYPHQDSTAVLAQGGAFLLFTLGYFLASTLSFLIIYGCAHGQAILHNALLKGPGAPPPAPTEVRAMMFTLYTSFVSIVLCQERSVGMQARLFLAVTLHVKVLVLTMGLVSTAHLVMGIGKTVADGLYWPEGLNKQAEDAAADPMAGAPDSERGLPEDVVEGM